MTFPFFLSINQVVLAWRKKSSHLLSNIFFRPPSVFEQLPSHQRYCCPELHTYSFSSCLYCASRVKIWGWMLTGFDTLAVRQRQVFWSTASQPVNTFMKQLSSAPGSHTFSSFPLVPRRGRTTRYSFVESKRRQTFELRYIFTFYTSFFFFYSTTSISVKWAETSGRKSYGLTDTRLV